MIKDYFYTLKTTETDSSPPYSVVITTSTTNVFDNPLRYKRFDTEQQIIDASPNYIEGEIVYCYENHCAYIRTVSGWGKIQTDSSPLSYKKYATTSAMVADHGLYVNGDIVFNQQINKPCLRTTLVWVPLLTGIL